MNTARRLIGLLLIVFLGLPTLFGIIWAVGMIKASVSAEFLTDLPREIIADIPGKADEIFREAQNEQVIADDNTRAWFQAAAKTGISPGDLLEKTGLLGWLDGELSDSLRQIGRVLRGERRLRPITIDLRPLQTALLHPEVDRFLEETLKNLPPCDERGRMLWGELAMGDIRRHQIPSCQPDLETAKAVLAEARRRAVRDMDDRIEVFEGVRSFPLLPFGISGTITFLSYFLFLIPAAFIFLGALIAASSPASFFRWSGVSVLVGGVPTLLLALATKFFSLWAIKAAPFFEHDYWASDLGDLVLNKLSWIPERIVNQLFSPVVWVSAMVCVVGVVLYALSFTVRDNARKARKPVSPPPAPAVPPKTEG
ncbi:MAG TPA: hypothetical protein VMW46_07950 [Candidatus Desulfaltia sp.]|nr:hypothetical protein [Candidatus Desulfaltia sp.]